MKLPAADDGPDGEPLGSLFLANFDARGFEHFERHAHVGFGFKAFCDRERARSVKNRERIEKTADELRGDVSGKRIGAGSELPFHDEAFARQRREADAVALQFAGKRFDGAAGEPPAANELCAASESGSDGNQIAKRRSGFAAVYFREPGGMIPVDRNNVGVSRIALGHPGA